MAIRGILIITPTGIIYGRTSIIRNPTITASRTPGTVARPISATATIDPPTAIKPKGSPISALRIASFPQRAGTAKPAGFDS
jgi:hypothetical protein